MTARVPGVTVLMTVYNADRYLDEAIRSIRSQSYDNFEFLILNDGSTDGSARVLDAHAAQDPRIRVLHLGRCGRVAALNLGIDEAQAPLLALMDADDVALPDRLALQVRRFREQEDLGVLGGHIRVIDGKGAAGHVIRYPMGEKVGEMLAYGAPVAQPAVMMRLDLIRSLGGYRPFFVHCEDYDLWLRVSEKARIDNLDDVVLHYRWHGENVSCKYRETQVTGTFLAQAAWFMRRRGDTDAVETWPSISRDLLFALPLPGPEKRGLLVRWARTMIISQQDGEFADGERMIDELRRLPGRFDAQGKRDMAKMHGKLAYSAYALGARRKALHHAVAAFCYAPLWAAREAVRRVCRI